MKGQNFFIFFTHGVTFHLSPWSLFLYICFFLYFFLIALLLYPLFCIVSHCHWNSSSLMLFFTQWQPECTIFLQSKVVGAYQYKHSCSTEMASPCFNYPSYQLRWKDTAPDKARPHSLILHRPFSHHQMQRRPSANSQMKPRDGCCPKHQANCTVQRRVTECLWHLTNGVYSTPTIVPGFLKHRAFAHQWWLDRVWITSRWSG